MGNKSKKVPNKKKKSSNKKQKRKQILEYKTRRDKLLEDYPQELLMIWFNGDDEKIKKFGDYLLTRENRFSEESTDSLFDGKSYYEEKLDRLYEKKCKSINDIILVAPKIKKLKKKIANGERFHKAYKEKDLGIATYLNSDRYKKRLLSKSKYRKELKHIAKQEKKEADEMRRLGYIKSKDPDKELNKLLKANECMNIALSDAYVQKHFIDE